MRRLSESIPQALATLFALALALGYSACGSDSKGGGPPVQPKLDASAGSGGQAGNTSFGGAAGSGGLAGFSSGGSAGSTGVGGAGGSGVVTLEQCDALCVWQVDVAGDCPSDAVEQCQASFKVGALGKSESCIQTLEAWCYCFHQFTDPTQVSCTEGRVTSNIPVTTGEVAECSVVTDDWVKCNQ